jgi:hypothetical protein
MVGGGQQKTGLINWQALARQLLFIGLVIGLPVGIGTAPGIFRDGDVSWHVAAGDWIMKHGRIPTTDPFSFTAAGQPWVATEWLSEVILASAFRAAGYAGLATIVAGAMIALNAIIFFYLERRTSPLLLFTSVFAMNLVLAPFVMARPHVLAWPLLAAWTVLLLAYAEKGRPPPLWSAALLLLWTNLHTSFPLAAPVGAAIALDSLIDAKWKTLREWLIFALVSLLCLLANANGIAGILQPFHISNLDMLSVIGEWHPTTTHNTPEFFVVLLGGLGFLLWRGVHFQVGRLVVLLVMLGMAFVHVRHQSSFIIIAACIIPPLLLSKPATPTVPKPLLLAALPLLCARAIFPLTPPESAANPRHLIAAIPAELRGKPVFNGYTFGGPLILAGIRPYIDGRGEMYGDAFVSDYVNITNGDLQGFNDAVERYGIGWTMLPRSSKRLIDEIESSRRWQRLYSDDIGVLDVQIAGPSASEPPAKPGHDGRYDSIARVMPTQVDRTQENHRPK